MTNGEKKVRQVVDAEETPGTGALCPEAQADGVPCFEKGRECSTCEKAASAERRGENKEDTRAPQG